MSPVPFHVMGVCSVGGHWPPDSPRIGRLNWHTEKSPFQGGPDHYRRRSPSRRVRKVLRCALVDSLYLSKTDNVFPGNAALFQMGRKGVVQMQMFNPAVFRENSFQFSIGQMDCSYYPAICFQGICEPYLCQSRLEQGKQGERHQYQGVGVWDFTPCFGACIYMLTLHRQRRLGDVFGEADLEGVDVERQAGVVAH